MVSPREVPRGELAVSENTNVAEHPKTGDIAPSQRLAAIGEAVFFATLTVLGCLGLGLVIGTIIVPQWRALHEYREARCTVQATRIFTNSSGRTIYHVPKVLISYEVDGQALSAWTLGVRELRLTNLSDANYYLSGFQEGREYPCWYDPHEPSQVVLRRGYSGWAWLFLLLPIAFLVIGIGGLGYTLIHFGTSVERRSVLARQATGLEVFDPRPRLPRFPGVPPDTEIINSPGSTLRYRLPSATAPSWQLFGMGLLCVLWNLLAAIPAVISIHGFIVGDPEWMLAIVCLPFLAIGAGLAYLFARKLVAAGRIGPTQVEISSHPLKPGGEFELLVSQPGRLVFRTLRVLLLAEEEATYSQGTDTRTDVQRVVEQVLFARENFSISPREPLHARVRFRIPEGAMHSFQAEFNSLQWRIAVEGHADHGRDFVRSFPVVVCPSTHGGGRI